METFSYTRSWQNEVEVDNEELWHRSDLAGLIWRVSLIYAELEHHKES